MRLFLVDSSIGDAEEAAEIASRAGASVARYRGDIGAPWLDRLEPTWRAHPHAVAGITYAGAFFCLEQLARSYGLVCTFRSSLPTIASQTSSVSPLASANAQAAAIRRLALAVLRASALRPAQRIEAGRDEHGDAPLVWLLRAPTARREMTLPDQLRGTADAFAS
ncbi:MAG: hypothetical protein R3C58_15455 [Parvularculaceae bacterium]